VPISFGIVPVRLVPDRTSLFKEDKKVKLEGSVPNKLTYLKPNATTSLLKLQVIPNHPQGVSLLESQLFNPSGDPFKLLFHERRVSPCWLTAKAVKGKRSTRVEEKNKKEKRGHGFTGITAMLQTPTRGTAEKKRV
jgi:hypothetical protein